jgi:hypothetical protein
METFNFTSFNRASLLEDANEATFINQCRRGKGLTIYSAFFLYAISSQMVDEVKFLFQKQVT